MYANMTPLTRATQETMKIIDPNDAMIPMYIPNVICKSSHDHLVAYMKTTLKTHEDSKTIHATVRTHHAHQVVLFGVRHMDCSE